MAWRIHQSIVRGEIDNRVRDVVSGKIWLVDREEPIILTLCGNAHPDLAGCHLTFTNPLKPIPHAHLDSLHAKQDGRAGDLTAARKVRVFEVPLEEALAMIRRNEKPPEHMANGLYLEWFSERNGRVVIESTDFQLTISPPEWKLTPEQDKQRAEDAAAGLLGFMQQLGDAVAAHQPGPKSPEARREEPGDEESLRGSPG